MSLYDVAIIGGGPAGSTAATVLAQRGYRVIVLEKEQFPRFIIGESLLPFSMDALDRIGVMDKLQAAGFFPKHGAHISSGCGSKDIKFYFKNSFQAKYSSALQVTRAEFDLLLLDHAKEQGVEVHYKTRVISADFQKEVVSLMTESLTDPTAPKREITAKYLLDCSGRNSVVGTKYQLKRTYPKLKKIAVFAHFEGVPIVEGPEGTLTNMIREDDRWFWVIPLATDKISLGVVTDLDTFKALKQSPEEFLQQAIARQPLLQTRLRNGRRVTEVYASGDYSYRNTTFQGDRWLLAGDAAGFIDPVFSSGVFIAIFSGENAAIALANTLQNPALRKREFRNYERNLQRIMKLYHTFVKGWYRQEFIETILNPHEFFGVVSAVNAVLAGNPGRDFSVLWRLWLFRLLVVAQRVLHFSPSLKLRPQ